MSSQRASELSGSTRLEHQRVIESFERAWFSGAKPDISNYLVENPHLRHALLIELVHVDFELRRKAGENVDADFYVAKFPELAADETAVQNLRMASASSGSIATTPLTNCGSISDADCELHPIATAARFRIVRPHARGGLGQVSLAVDEEMHREVAIKEIQPCHANDPTNRRRFVIEAEITGSLEHPGIVPVYGMGRYSDGRPYYAMRFIRGESLKTALDEFHRADNPNRKDFHSRQLEFRQLLARFIAVCNTIEYAHSRGVLHRDLKPSNIMLGKYGETLVVDWGLAKCYDDREISNADEIGSPSSPGSTPSSPQASLVASGLGFFEGRQTQSSSSYINSHHTQPGTSIGTPAYRSPEQAAGRVDGNGRASDIFGLGATLYHILCGEPPLHGSSATLILKQASRVGFTKPQSRNAEVPKALEAVCLKAMAFRPSDRYGSAESLASELERWLADEPVRAYREPVTMRLARWMRGHKTLVGTATALLSASFVTATIAASLVSAERDRTYREGQRADFAAKRADLAAQSADLAAQQAETSQRTATEVATLLQQLFRSVDPIGIDGFGMRERTQRVADVTARQLLDSVAREVSERLDQSPEIQASLFETMGNTYCGLGDYSTADEFLTKSLAIRSRLVGEEHATIASILFSLGILRENTGKYEEAEQLFRRAIDLRTRLAGPGEMLVASIKFQLARLLCVQPFALNQNRERNAEAETLIRDALAIRREILGPNHHDVGVTLATLSGIRMSRGAEKEAESLLIEALQILDRPENASDMGSAAFYWSQGETLRKLRRFKEAVEPLEQLVEVIRRQLGDEHPTHATMLANLAGAQRQAGDFRGAEKSIRESLDIARKSSMRSQPSVLDWFLQLADGLCGRNDFEEAESIYREVMQYGEQGDAVACAPLINRARQKLEDVEKVKQSAAEGPK